MKSLAVRGRCWGGSIACSDCSDHIYQYAKFGACFQKCTNIVLSHWTMANVVELDSKADRIISADSGSGQGFVAGRD